VLGKSVFDSLESGVGRGMGVVGPATRGNGLPLFGGDRLLFHGALSAILGR